MNISVQDQILKLVKEAPRTTKSLAQALGISKQEVAAYLNRLPVKSAPVTSYKGSARPVTIVFYSGTDK